ncbi:MAG: hypothetical protein ABSH56_17005 [Bryobacteraceae bacterium]
MPATHFGLIEIRLLSNNPDQGNAVERAGVKVVEPVPCVADPITARARYLRTTRQKMGHLL